MDKKKEFRREKRENVEELNVQRSTFNIQRSIKEMLNTEDGRNGAPKGCEGAREKNCRDDENGN